MGLENISGAVLDSARVEADHILKVARKAAEDKLKAARKAAEQDAERQYQAAVRAIEEEFSRKLIQVKGGANKELLSSKNQCLRKIFDVAREQILSLPPEKYAGVMHTLLARAAAEYGGRLRIHPKDNDVFAAALAELNQERPPEARIEIDEADPLPEQGGFVFVSEGFHVDQTLRTLLTDIEHELAPQIAAEVFGG